MKRPKFLLNKIALVCVGMAAGASLQQGLASYHATHPNWFAAGMQLGCATMLTGIAVILTGIAARMERRSVMTDREITVEIVERMNKETRRGR